ncbi:hypothetical protein C6502_21960 [Candidatus Poribacteria bacterium]|nr:MAG: hypothetical protein C6502_21960 [Candidatus Poribacteria bacterium]
MKIQRILLIWTTLLLAVIPQFSCEKKEEHHHEQVETQKTDAHHEHTAPHGGTLVVFGDEFAHIELVLDQTTGKLTGYVLDGEAEKSVRLSQKTIELKIHREDIESDFSLQLSGVANVLTGETEGDTSQFAAQSDGLKGASEFHAEIVSITVQGQMFTDIDFEFPEGNEETHSEHGEH